ncbi:MAG TPA: phosphoribosyltransferase family protein [Gemmatimonadales bacterium]|nr:phosphoribosyltransferase family protein [Gemmatimonadales bacterium]
MFRDRADAGRRLAAALAPYAAARPIVLGLPRGGVVVGYYVARGLGAPLDVIVARKLGAPGQPELAIGAIAPGVTVVEETVVRELRVPAGHLARITAAERRELERRDRVYRGDRPPPDLTGRTVIVVDDGLATGATARAAIAAVRTQNPAAIVLAVPVAAADSAARLRGEVDDLVCLDLPSGFEAVSQFYYEFLPVDDDEVRAYL